MESQNKQVAMGCAVLIIAALIFIGVGILIHKYWF